MATIKHVTHPRFLGRGQLGRTPDGQYWRGDGRGGGERIAQGEAVVSALQTPTVLPFAPGGSTGPRDTDELSEGSTNLYFTDTRTYTKAKAILQSSTNITVTANDSAQTLTIAAHAQQHSITSTADHTFPGGTDVFLRGDGQYVAPSTGSGSTSGVVIHAVTLSSSGTDSYAGTCSPSISSYVDGNMFLLIPDVVNTTAATLNLHGLGAVDLKNRVSGTGNFKTFTDSGILKAGYPALFIYSSAESAFLLVAYHV